MIYIVEYIEQVVQSMQDANGAPYFFKGHRSEVNQVLSTMDKDAVRKSKRYPCIILWMDIDEKPVSDFWQFTLNLTIAAPTDKQVIVGNAPIDTRLNNVIYPVLIPLYERFILAIEEAGLFFWESNLLQPPHTKTVRPYWGVPTAERNRSFLLDEKLDVIEIRNLILNMEDDCPPQIQFI